MRRTKQAAEQTRQAILGSAVALFAEQGFSQTSLGAIAKRAQVTRGAIYWHFKNKVDIFDAIHHDLYTPLTDMILKDIQVNHPQPLRQLQELCVKLLVDLADNRQKQQALTLFLLKYVYVGELAAVRERHEKKKHESVKLFALYFEKAKQIGTLPESIDPNVLVLAVRCYLKGIVVEYLNEPEQFNLAAHAESLVNQLFLGIYASKIQ